MALDRYHVPHQGHADAGEAQLRQLIARVDDVAEIPRALRHATVARRAEQPTVAPRHQRSARA